jgi:hypothetical protein
LATLDAKDISLLAASGKDDLNGCLTTSTYWRLLVKFLVRNVDIEVVANAMVEDLYL